MRNYLFEYLGRLEKAGELVRVEAPVSPELEIAEITDRISKSPGGGSSLLFTNVEGSDFPVATNLFGSRRRIAMALGAESLDEIAGRLEYVLQEALAPRGSLVEKARTLPLLAEMSRWFPRRTKGRGACQQIVLQGGLSALPILKCWPHDGGRFVTLPLVHTVDPETGARNVGMYRMQMFDDRTTGMHWHVHKTGARHYEAYKRAGIAKMPVSVCLGGDPAYTYAATAPMPDGMDEYLLAGFLRRKPVKLVECLTNELWVPADCDFVIEGWVDTTEPLRSEGPFGDHTGFYSLEDLYPVFHLSAITHRRDAVWPATLVGVPPQEDAYFAEATERIFLPPIRLALQPEVRDLYMPPAGVAHNLAIVAMDSSYAGQTEKVASALWGAGQMMFNKVLIAAPAGFPIRDTNALLQLLQGIDPARDMVFGHGVLDVLDHATTTPGRGGKLLIDATQVRPDAIGVRAEFLFDEAAADLTPYEKLWLGLANIDPARDITIKEGVAVVNCRAKVRRGCEKLAAAGEQTGAAPEKIPARWPNVVASSPETVALVNARWSDYDLGEFIPSPSERYRKLLLSDGAEV